MFRRSTGWTAGRISADHDLLQLTSERQTTFWRLTMWVAVWMSVAVSSLQQTHKLLYNQESNDPTENPQTHWHHVSVGSSCAGGWKRAPVGTDTWTEFDSSLIKSHLSLLLMTVNGWKLYTCLHILSRLKRQCLHTVGVAMVMWLLRFVWVPMVFSMVRVGLCAGQTGNKC